MSTRCVSQFVLNKPGNLGAADPSGISAEMTIKMFADDDTAEPAGIVIILNTLTKGETTYIINNVTGEDNYIVIELAEEALE